MSDRNCERENVARIAARLATKSIPLTPAPLGVPSKNAFPITGSLEDRMNQVHNASIMLGRIFLAALYVWSGFGKIGNFAFFEHYAATAGVSPSMLIASIVVELGGALLILVGYHARIAALILAAFSIAAILLFYGVHPAGLQAQIIALAELAAAGGFLVLAGSGAGGWSLDAFLAGRRAESRGANAGEASSPRAI